MLKFAIKELSQYSIIKVEPLVSNHPKCKDVEGGRLQEEVVAHLFYGR